MKIKNNSSLSESNYYILQDSKFFENQKIAGQCVAHCLYLSKKMIEDIPQLSLLDIERRCLAVMKMFGCTPTFLNYVSQNKPPFPGAICVSVNNELVHGIPRDYKLQEGDVVKIDLGATYEGAIADAATTIVTS
jgi:methionyl aminopeptidase